MDNNSVHLIGRVKRNAEASAGVLDFAIEVTNLRGRCDIFDCRLTTQSAAYQQLEGFVNEGESIEVVGHLEKYTRTEGKRLAGVWVEAKTTDIVVYVDSIVETEGEDVD